MSDDRANVLALVRDLMFSSRIAAEARAAGVGVKLLRDPARLAAEPGGAGVLLLVDLNQPDALDAAARWRDTTGGAVVGFVSHVDAATIGRARAAGLDRVLARSRFVEVLPALLREPRAG